MNVEANNVKFYYIFTWNVWQRPSECSQESRSILSSSSRKLLQLAFSTFTFCLRVSTQHTCTEASSSKQLKCDYNLHDSLNLQRILVGTKQWHSSTMLCEIKTTIVYFALHHLYPQRSATEGRKKPAAEISFLCKMHTHDDDNNIMMIEFFFLYSFPSLPSLFVNTAWKCQPLFGRADKEFNMFTRMMLSSARTTSPGDTYGASCWWQTQRDWEAAKRAFVKRLLQVCRVDGGMKNECCMRKLAWEKERLGWAKWAIRLLFRRHKNRKMFFCRHELKN